MLLGRESERPSWSTLLLGPRVTPSIVKWLSVLPCAIALAKLLDEIVEARIFRSLHTETLFVVVLCPLATRFFARRRSGRQAAWCAAGLAACVVAPLAVLGSWGLMPGGLVGGAAGL